MKRRGVRRRGPAACAAARASSSARRPSRACRSRSGTIPTAASIARRTSSSIPNVWRHGDWAELTEHDGHDHPWPQRRDAQSGRRPHRHGGDLPPGRAASGDRREPRDRTGAWQQGDVRIVLFVRLRAGPRSSTTRCATGSGARSGRTRRRTTCRSGSSRWPTSRARSAARSPSSPCATWCTVAGEERGRAGEPGGAGAVPGSGGAEGLSDVSCGRSARMTLELRPPEVVGSSARRQPHSPHSAPPLY